MLVKKVAMEVSTTLLDLVDSTTLLPRAGLRAVLVLNLVDGKHHQNGAGPVWRLDVG